MTDLEYMKERFDQVTDSIEKMERGVGKRFDGIEADVKILTDYRSQTTGSLSTIRYVIGIGFSLMGVILYMITMYLKHK